MKKTIVIFLSILSLVTYGQNDSASRRYNQKLAAELNRMVEFDQLAANNAFPPEEFKYLTQSEWEKKKDSIYNTHKIRLAEIFNLNGYPGYDLVGKKGEHNFWLLVQHSDSDPKFQNMILKYLEAEVKLNNANARNFGLLTDRVKINTSQKQVYGTQVFYNKKTGQAMPQPMVDSLNVNSRRKSVGLEPIEEYLNLMSEMHFEMNKSNMIKRGITAPKRY